MNTIMFIATIFSSLSTLAIARFSFTTIKRMNEQNKIMREGFLHAEKENIKSRLGGYCVDALSIIEETKEWLEEITKMEADDMKSHNYKKIIDTKRISLLQTYFNVLRPTEQDRQEPYCESIKKLSDMELGLLKKVENHLERNKFPVLQSKEDGISNNAFNKIFNDFQNAARIQLSYIKTQADIKCAFSNYLKEINSDR